MQVSCCCFETFVIGVICGLTDTGCIIILLSPLLQFIARHLGTSFLLLLCILASVRVEQIL